VADDTAVAHHVSGDDGCKPSADILIRHARVPPEGNGRREFSKMDRGALANYRMSGKVN
jgi:hypothetical protein